MIHAIIILLGGALLFLMGIAFKVPYEATLYLCGMGLFFMYAAIIIAVFVDEGRRGRALDRMINRR